MSDQCEERRCVSLCVNPTWPVCDNRPKKREGLWRLASYFFYTHFACYTHKYALAARSVGGGEESQLAPPVTHCVVPPCIPRASISRLTISRRSRSSALPCASSDCCRRCSLMAPARARCSPRGGLSRRVGTAPRLISANAGAAATRLGTGHPAAGACAPSQRTGVVSWRARDRYAGTSGAHACVSGSHCGPRAAPPPPPPPRAPRA